MRKLTLLLIALIIYNTPVTLAQTTNTNMVYKGMNIAGAEFNGGRKNAKHFKDYIWPTNKNIKEIKTLGLNTIRVPFAWERMQTNVFNELDKEQLKQLDRVVQQSHQLGINVVLDPHSYGKYKRKVLETNQMDLRAFADLWSKLATRYNNYPNVIYGLMNEPYKQTADDWAKFAQVGIDAIRKTGSEHLILVPGTYWDGMHSWLTPIKGISNAEALAQINDPLDNFAFEMHQYFDKDSSGTHQKCINTELVIKKFEKTTAWLKKHRKKAFLGEFGVPENKQCIADLKATLDFMTNNKREWIGWTYWSAGDWMIKYPFYVLDRSKKSNQRLELLMGN